MFKSDSIYYSSFVSTLDTWGRQFDPLENMVAWQSSGRGYHSRNQGLTHSVRDSADYACLLLETGRPEDRERACAVIERILPLQDTDPESRSFGVWPYAMEEPLSRMLAVDYNWADFIGRDFAEAILDHSGELPSALAGKMKEALRRACACIIRRNVGPDYTNINLMGALVTILSGMILPDGAIEDYGRRRLLKAVRYTEWNGNVTEFNSPTYMRLDAEIVGEMRYYFKNPEYLKAAEELNRYIWGCIARHCQASAGQWAGPHSRCYSALQEPSYLRWLEAAAQFRVRVPGSEAGDAPYYMGKYPIRCPDEYLEYLKTPSGPRWITELFYKKNAIITPDEERTQIRDEETPDLEARTYLTEKFSLASFAQSDLWAQRSALIAYWGTVANPRYMRLRCLHDAYDYSSAMLFVSQKRNRAVGAVNFATDHGDFHFILDPLRGKSIRAKKLSVRFEFGGDIEGMEMRRREDREYGFEIRSDGVGISIEIPYCGINGRAAGVETGGDDKTRWIEVVFYRGEERIIDFGMLKEAAMAFALTVSTGRPAPEEAEKVKCQRHNDRLGISAGGAEGCRVEIPVRPLSYLDDLRQSLVL